MEIIVNPQKIPDWHFLGFDLKSYVLFWSGLNLGLGLGISFDLVSVLIWYFLLWPCDHDHNVHDHNHHDHDLHDLHDHYQDYDHNHFGIGLGIVPTLPSGQYAVSVFGPDWV